MKNLRFINGLQRKYQSSVTAHVQQTFSEMTYMAYQYEDLNRKGLLGDEEEVSSSNKRKFETDSPETSTQPEASSTSGIRKKPKFNSKKVKLRKGQ